MPVYMKVVRFPVWILLFVLPTGLFAQQFGGNPPSLKWRQINTDTARVIFPLGLDSTAQQVAAIVHRLSRTTLPTIGGRQAKINIVLQNQTIVPNGYVQLAPFRSEFQLTPSQNSFELGSLPWPKTLAIHEYRHVQQYNNFRIGLSKTLYYLFGEGGQELANSLTIPNWFWEGDAVYQETLVSDQGRGRQPYFFNGYRALWAGGKNYSWMKLRNGSLRDYVPDHYPLGYMLVSYGREKYGDDFWKKVTLDAASFKGLFYPLQKGIEKYAGTSFRQFRQDAIDHFRAPQQDQDEYARAHRHFVANEEFPQWIGQDSIFYVRSSYKQIPAFVIRDLKGGGESVLENHPIALDNYFSYRNGLAVYAAYETDPRWGWRNYNVIRVLDLATGADRKISSRTRYFSPDISADGRRIVTVQESTDGRCDLVLLDARTGAVEKTVPNKNAWFYTYPKFYKTSAVVSAVRDTKGQMALAKIDLENGATDLLTPFTFQTIGFPSVQGDTVWYTASHNGKDQVFAYANGSLFHVLLPPGAGQGQYEFQYAAGRGVWNSFSATGYRIAASGENALHLEALSAGDWQRPLPTQGIDVLEKGPAHLLDGIAAGNYPTSKYPAATSLFNFHSWRPYINDPDYTFSLVSENVLNTFGSEIFVGYNRNEQYKQAGAVVQYAGLYPRFDAGWTYTFDRNALYRNTKVFWNESELRGGMSVPLNFTRNKTFTYLQFGSDLVYNQRYYQGVYKDSFNTKPFAYITPYISLATQSQQAPQQIYPRLAATLYLGYNTSVTTLVSHQFLASGYVYLPGFAYTNNIILGLAFQQRDSLRNARYSNSFPYSRGYSAENFYRMTRFSANYHIPLLYPDWGIANIVYFQRIRANLYYDYTKVLDFYSDGHPYNGEFRSYGTEIYFDTKWWNQLPISFGIRYSRLMDPDFEGRGPNQWEFILPINLLGR